MAVTTTTIAGTDSLSGSRITINDNFKTLENALNSVLSVFDIVSGRFNNAVYGSANDIITNGITVNGTGLTDGVTVSNGNVNILVGDIKIADNYGLKIGTIMEFSRLNTAKISGGNYATWDMASVDGVTTNDTIAGVKLPKLTGAGLNDIASSGGGIPQDGTLVFSGFKRNCKLWCR